MVSMFAFLIALGMIVDDAIIVTLDHHAWFTTKRGQFHGVYVFREYHTNVGDVRFAPSPGTDRAHDVVERGFLLR